MNESTTEGSVDLLGFCRRRQGGGTLLQCEIFSLLFLSHEAKRAQCSTHIYIYTNTMHTVRSVVLILEQ